MQTDSTDGSTIGLSALQRWAPVVTARLNEILPTETGVLQPLSEAMRYSALAPGKRLRPALCLLCADAVGGATADALDPACALEMIHCFSLIHDDLPAIDNDDLRRGKPTLHRAFSESVAILAGDALFALAFETLSKAPLPSTIVAAALLSLTSAVGVQGLVGGEMADVLSEGRRADKALVKMIHERKTGALFAAACEIGALCGNAEPQTVRALKSYGASLGLAFQIADDLLNETGASEAIGKSVGSDRARNKQTYPAAFGIEESQSLANRAVGEAIAVLPTSLNRRPELISIAEFAVERRH